jgi:hypothetical protein
MIYKFIDIPNYEVISEKVYDFIVNKTPILRENATWNFLPKDAVLHDIPELLEVFKNLGDLVPLNLSIVKCRPRANISVHIDSDNYARLLWPIKNCKGSYTKFFEVDNANIEKRYGVKKDLYYHINNVEDAKLLENVELTQPIVFKPWVPHGVWSNPEYTDPRLTLTIKFNKSFTYKILDTSFSFIFLIYFMIKILK